MSRPLPPTPEDAEYRSAAAQSRDSDRRGRDRCHHRRRYRPQPGGSPRSPRVSAAPPCACGYGTTHNGLNERLYRCRRKCSTCSRGDRDLVSRGRLLPSNNACLSAGTAPSGDSTGVSARPRTASVPALGRRGLRPGPGVRAVVNTEAHKSPAVHCLVLAYGRGAAPVSRFRRDGPAQARGSIRLPVRCYRNCTSAGSAARRHHRAAQPVGAASPVSWSVGACSESRGGGRCETPGGRAMTPRVSRRRDTQSTHPARACAGDIDAVLSRFRARGRR
jgi:hypothetical protein